MQNSVLRKVFRLTLASYFVANLMTVLGSVIRMIMAGAEEVRYTSMLDLNNLLIIIRKELEKEKPGDAEEAQE